MQRSLAALLLALVLTGCGKTADLPGEPVDDGPRARFFTALTEDLGAARELVVPGSAAARYVDFQARLAAARSAASVDPADTVVRRSAGGYLLCEKGPDEPRCAEFTHVVAEGARLRSFDVDGEPVGGRVVGPGRAVPAASAGRVQLVGAYAQPSTRSLWVLVRLEAGKDDVSVHLEHGHYRREGAETGTGVLQAGEVPVVAAGDSAVLAAVVPHGRLGGSLQLAFVVKGAKVFVELPVRK